MAFSHDDLAVLSDLVIKEQGKQAVPHVSNYVDKLRHNGDTQNAKLWSIVLGMVLNQTGGYRKFLQK